MKKTIAVMAILATSVASSMATTTILFNEVFTGGVSSNLSDAAGLAGVDGLKYGLIFDTNGGSFANTTYDAISDPVFGSTFALFFNGIATDAIVVMAGDLTADQSFGGIFTDVSGTTGTVGGVSGVTVTYGNGIAAGQSFALIWFDPSLGSAGLLTSPEFILPGDTGATLPFDAVFEGADPIRSATGVTFVPEPSAALLGAIGALGLLRRRRN